MKFSTSEDIAAPAQVVFDMLCEFESFERAAMRRGADVRRLDHRKTPGVGMAWHAGFVMRGKPRDLEIEMAIFDPPNEILLETTSPGMLGQMHFDLMALSRTHTRMTIGLEVRALNLSARLLVQSMKLARGALTRKFKQRVSEYAKGMEERHLRPA